jgi:multicomponent Na+:H+ antiporter subunit E
MLSMFLVNLLLALLWASFQSFRPIDLVGGLLIGYGLIYLVRVWLGFTALRYLRWMPTFIRFLIYYAGMLVTSTWGVIVALFRDQSTLKPGIVALKLDAKTDLEIVLLNNLLSMTPGTLGVDLSPDRTMLYVHIIDVPDPDKACDEIKNGLEKRLLEVTR